MEKKDNSPAITKSYAKKMETISPFELKNKLIEMADESIKKIAHTMLNAGRGNPNWIATEPREAFFLLGQFGLCECRRVLVGRRDSGYPAENRNSRTFRGFLER
jgi:aspartate 4-decarboxylase